MKWLLIVIWINTAGVTVGTPVAWMQVKEDCFRIASYLNLKTASKQNTHYDCRQINIQL